MLMFDILIARFNRSKYKYLGEYFCEHYIAGEYPNDIYLEKNNIIANSRINKWLENNGYLASLPEFINKIDKIGF